MEENSAYESLISGAFDREYGLADLLPVEDLTAILKPFSDFLYIKIINRNGSAYFSPPEKRSDAVDHWVQTALDQNLPQVIEDGYWEEFKVLFPLKHEGEPIGYFSVAFSGDNLLPPFCFKAFGKTLNSMLNRVIRLNCQIQMTSGLQSQVVEDSYAQLQSKADQLAISERKYRLLAESLEEEVQKKAQTIQKALSTLAQQEKMASVGQLAAGVAHEINNPMGFIISNLGSLKGYGDDLRSFFETCNQLISDAEKESFEEYRTKVGALYQELDIDFILSDLVLLITESIEGAERIKRIVMDLKEFSKPGLSDAVPVDLNKLLQNILSVCRTHIGGEITIETDCKPLPTIFGHPQQINQAIVNILLNAVQAMAGNGHIIITTRTLDEYVEMSIEDTGCGIEKDVLTKIFDPFFTTKEVGNGTGLGLTFAYNVIRKHHGKISVESEVNKGSKFTLHLPCKSK